MTKRAFRCALHATLASERKDGSRKSTAEPLNKPMAKRLAVTHDHRVIGRKGGYENVLAHFSAHNTETMTNCPACLIAADDPHTGHYTAACQECKARALAQSPTGFQAHKLGKRTPQYVEALLIWFGAGNELHHERVKYWAGRTKKVE